MITTLTLNPALDIATTTAAVRPTHKLRCAPPRHDAGGGGINVARVLVELGGETCAVFPAGGPAGDMVCRLLAQAGVPFAEVPIAGLTRESFSITDEQSGEQYRFVLPGAALDAETQGALLARIATLQPAPTWLVVSGSMPPGVDSGFFVELRAWCERTGCRIILDSSGPGLVAARALGAWLVKPSLSELEGLTGHVLETGEARIAAARAMLGSYEATAILVSLGGEGALLVTRDEAIAIPSVPVEAVSTIGAGDTMVAALALKLYQGRPLEEAARYGVAAGAAALLNAGTGLARLADIERLYAALLRLALDL